MIRRNLLVSVFVLLLLGVASVSAFEGQGNRFAIQMDKLSPEEAAKLLPPPPKKSPVAKGTTLSSATTEVASPAMRPSAPAITTAPTSTPVPAKIPVRNVAVAASLPVTPLPKPVRAQTGTTIILQEPPVSVQVEQKASESLRTEPQVPPLVIGYLFAMVALLLTIVILLVIMFFRQ